jgi:hypothetical protein
MSAENHEERSEGVTPACEQEVDEAIILRLTPSKKFCVRFWVSETVTTTTEEQHIFEAETEEDAETMFRDEYGYSEDVEVSHIEMVLPEPLQDDDIFSTGGLKAAG